MTDGADDAPASLETLRAELLAIRERIANLEVRKVALEERILCHLFGVPEGFANGGITGAGKAKSKRSLE